jgi:hypothetical protein
MLSGGLTTTFADADLVVSVTEVAVTVTVRLDVTEAGVLYVAVVLVVLVKLPQALPEHAAPETAHVTPWFWLSLVTVAVMASVCP